jgi:hypothetical protein
VTLRHISAVVARVLPTPVAILLESAQQMRRQTADEHEFTVIKGLKARKKIAQGKRSETSAALGCSSKNSQALKGRRKVDENVSQKEQDYVSLTDIARLEERGSFR